MKRLIQNPNLTLFYDERFLSNPVIKEHAPLCKEYLIAIKDVLDTSLTEYSRVYVQRIDLRYPSYYTGHNFGDISRFFSSLKAKIKHDLKTKGKVGKCTLRYVWVREQLSSGNPHYHVALFLNKDVYFCLGDITKDSDNFSSMIKAAWASALGIEYFEVKSSVHFPSNSTYYIYKGKDPYQEEYRQCFYRLSYLAKIDTKIYSNGLKNFSTSRK
ncbi:inovirus Gp2 family protein [Vibrio cholerae]|uniref:Inovirus Gp2 family protein n=5 Tax=Vibrio cholerae TaxID=666 RepID=A0A6B3LEG5_VIBCL|nr:inovirus Gp2 family protein [Vibrio cholerae]EGQ8202474.1 inovirus Gp2 family protein [Vibrio cholerae]EGQ8671695.1 inovirus Gp2 family protein [Vibrio cholerae]EGQ9464222.1 inovirus Gp2 family protein [Vibrio cholerae]EGQ9967189.1 inovirus Gp2 family protein [Vibrio cholerae]EGR0793166.1 inovirus Gp2 family protein [Vibrio cholerae]